MKTRIIFLVFLLLNVTISIHSYAQDIIVLKTGDEIMSIVKEVGIDAITYKKFDNQEGPIYSIEKSKVFMIKYQNGSKDVFTEEPKIEEKDVNSGANAPSPKPSGSVQQAQKSLVYQRGIRSENIVLTEQQICDIFNEYPEIKKLYDKGKGQKSVGEVLSWGSLGVLGFGIYKTTKVSDLTTKNEIAKRFLIGAAITQITSWVIQGVGNNNIRKTVDLYNSMINNIE
mgnify:FL=1